MEVGRSALRIDVACPHAVLTYSFLFTVEASAKDACYAHSGLIISSKYGIRPICPSAFLPSFTCPTSAPPVILTRGLESRTPNLRTRLRISECRPEPHPFIVHQLPYVHLCFGFARLELHDPYSVYVHPPHSALGVDTKCPIVLCMVRFASVCCSGMYVSSDHRGFLLQVWLDGLIF